VWERKFRDYPLYFTEAVKNENITVENKSTKKTQEQPEKRNIRGKIVFHMRLDIVIASKKRKCQIEKKKKMKGLTNMKDFKFMCQV